MTPRLAVIIVNYRIAEMVCDCLRSLEPEIAVQRGACVVVVDNDSQDGSAEKVRHFVASQGYGSWVQVVTTPHNGGFAFGNNFALRQLLPDKDIGAFLLLNPDTYVRPGVLKPLLEALDRDPRVGIVGTRLEDPDGTAQRSMFRFPSLLSEFEWSMGFGPITRLLKRWTVSQPVPDEPAGCGWVSGASMLIRRQVIEEIGLMDDAYFLYFEEVDYCLRAARAGWQSWYEPRSRVVHLIGASTGVSNPRSARRRLPAYWFDSRHRFFVKNYGSLYAAAADLSWMIGRTIGHIRRVLQRRPDRTPERFFRDFASHSVFVRGFNL